MSHEPNDASNYRPRFANPAGRISELENMLEFAKQEIENFRDKWVAEKRKAERRQALLGEVFSAFPPIQAREECELLARISREVADE
ncbi:hypothetical protein ABWH88_06605 [Marinobacter adhaerens]|uniref:Nucleotide exchange factor GrpE n=2 Tax=Marinobacter adhaerens TaxID=1033846 RepID=A0ABX8INZ1_9GAMM|nr:hypothetical protein [Marinobacter adhaerens]ADP96465.1 hypothetical protein HP15_701 [Marinobacter adhaerens HP15]MBW4979543.1 hypothetical protein [Marinobacter adhaerens]QWV14456.1 hypothetical protein KQ249_07645 [Marinobacter adhaerens]